MISLMPIPEGALHFETHHIWRHGVTTVITVLVSRLSVTPQIRWSRDT